MRKIDRFFQAYAELVMLGTTNRKQFCQDLGVDRRNFRKQEMDHARRILKPEWLSVLVVKFGVSADWLLTGRGWMFGA